MAKIIKPDLKAAQDMFVKTGKTVKVDPDTHTLLDPPKKTTQK